MKLIKSAGTVLFILLFVAGLAQELNPGVERWTIKTTIPSGATRKTVTLKKLLTLPAPITKNSNEWDEQRIGKSVKGLKEGDVVTTTGWLHLVALENDSKNHRDGDYHIQLRTSKEWGDSCFIIEMPYPGFIEKAGLKNQCARVREFVKKRLLKGKEPGRHGNVMKSEVYVTVTGQLFFDAPHVKGGLRGKKGMKSYTCWEIHPVTSIKFAVKP